MIILDDGTRKFDFRDYGAEVQWEHENQAQPEFGHMVKKIPRRAGLVKFGSQVNERYFKLTILLDTFSLRRLDELVDDLNGFLFDDYARPKMLKALVLYERKVRFVTLHEKVIPDPSTTLNSLELNFVSFDPYKYHDYKVNDIVWGSEKITFLDNWLLGNTGSGAQALKITGNKTIQPFVEGIFVAPIIIIKGSGTDVKLTCNDKTIELGTFSKSNIEVNVSRYSVTVDGREEMKKIDFEWGLMKGKDLYISGPSMDFEMTLEYNDRFI